MTHDHWAPVTEHDRIRADLAALFVAALTEVPRERILSPGRAPSERRARWTAIYLCHVALGWSLERVAHVFGVNRTSAANACRWAEDERDRPVMDAMLDRLEAQMEDALSPAPSHWLTGEPA